MSSGAHERLRNFNRAQRNDKPENKGFFRKLLDSVIGSKADSDLSEPEDDPNNHC